MRTKAKQTKAGTRKQDPMAPVKITVSVPTGALRVLCEAFGATSRRDLPRAMARNACFTWEANTPVGEGPSADDLWPAFAKRAGFAN